MPTNPTDARCTCFAREADECACGAWDDETDAQEAGAMQRLKDAAYDPWGDRDHDQRVSVRLGDLKLALTRQQMPSEEDVARGALELKNFFGDEWTSDSEYIEAFRAALNAMKGN